MTKPARSGYAWLLTGVSLTLAAQSARAQEAPVAATPQAEPKPPGLASAAPAGSSSLNTTARLNTTRRDVPLGGPLSDNGFVLGEISYVLKADDTIRVDAPALLLLIVKALNPESYHRVAEALQGRADVSADELKTLGMPVSYDPETFGLKLHLDPFQRPRQVLSVTGLGPSVVPATAEPADFSAYVTALGNIDYVHQGVENGFADPNILFDSAIRYKGFVLENEATLQGNFQRDATRLVYDDMARTARYAAGDLRPTSRGFSGASPMAGLSVERVYADLEPQRNIQPRGQRSFTLTRSSTVETFVNGSLVQQTRLDPGTYDIRDFPFAQGSNDVRLVLRDDSGVQTTLDFSINFDRTLLGKGLTEFGLYAGVATPFSGTGRTYSNDPLASGFYRRGFSDTVTAGGNFQASARGAVAGVELVWASPIGTLGFDLAASKVDNIGTGYALNIGYEYNILSGWGDSSSLIATVQTTSRNFSVADALFSNNFFVYELGLTYSLGFERDHYVSLDSFYSKGRDARPDQMSLRAIYGWRATTRLFLTSEATYQERGGNDEYGVRFALTYRFDARSSGTAEIDTRREGGRISYQTSTGRGVGSYNGQAAVDYFDGVGSFNGNVNVLLNRAELGAAHVTSYSADARDIIDQRSSLRFGTSLAFADGAFAVGRPIYDSFALLKPHETLKGAGVYVSPNDKEYLSRSGAFGAGVATDLSSYTSQLVTYDVPAAPVGYDIGPGAVQLLPPYRSGYRVDVGSSYSVTYTGQLVSGSGAPLVLVAGMAYELAQPKRAGVQMFTNRSGKFAVSGLRPGRWRIETGSGETKRTYFIEIPADADGLVRGAVSRPEDAK